MDVYVSGYNIRNTTEPLINFRVIGGRAYVQRNALMTGAVLGGRRTRMRFVWWVPVRI